jgi:mRNA interferase RelE/StbE
LSFEIIFEERAISRAADFLADDPTAVRALLDASDALAEVPRSPGSIPFSSPDVRWLRMDRYRVVYEIRANTIVVGHTGRASA